MYLSTSYKLSSFHYGYSLTEIFNRVKILHKHSNATSGLIRNLPDETREMKSQHDYLTHFVVNSRLLSFHVNKNSHIPVYINVEQCKRYNSSEIETKIGKLTTFKLFYKKKHEIASWSFRYGKEIENLMCNYYRK